MPPQAAAKPSARASEPAGARAAAAAAPPPPPPATPASAADEPPRKGPPPEPKPKLSKQERRELQESQRAAKAERGKGEDFAAETPSPARPASAAAPPPPAAVAPSGRAPPAEAARAAAKKAAGAAGRQATELFAHLPQFDAQALHTALSSASLTGGPSALHPAVLQLGCAYADGGVCGGRARCLALLRAMHAMICDYVTPPEKALARDLTARVNASVTFLIACRPLAVSMGNAVKSLKTVIADCGVRQMGEAEAKAALLDHLERYMYERIELADAAIEALALSKIADGDVILTHAASETVLRCLVAAKRAGRTFRVVVVDSRPRLEGRATLRALLRAGISCCYAHANGLTYAMRDVTKVMLGAAAVLGNGAVVSRVGAAAVALAARAFGAPVLVLAQTCKLHERTQLDSITSNELGDPGALASVDSRPEVGHLEGWAELPNLRLLNLTYDCTPASYVTAIITELGMLPPTSVPVVLREQQTGLA